MRPVLDLLRIDQTDRIPPPRAGEFHGLRIYLAGPRTWLEPEVWAPVEATLLDLGLIHWPARTAYRSVAAALRAAGASVFSPCEQAAVSDTALADARAGRAADRAALIEADVVVVLDGWEDVPGAVDAARLIAATRGTCWATATDALRGLGAEVSAA